jgi:hypothetical protein
MIDEWFLQHIDERFNDVVERWKAREREGDRL